MGNTERTIELCTWINSSVDNPDWEDREAVIDFIESFKTIKEWLLHCLESQEKLGWVDIANKSLLKNNYGQWNKRV